MSTSDSSLWAQRLSPRDVDAMPSKPADARVAYGKEPAQFGDLRLPKGSGPFPVVVILHGGCWIAEVASLQNTAAFADALRDAGVATWNVEYRRVGEAGGGWPGTFEDVGAAVDHVRELAVRYPVEPKRVVVTGHSAGAHLALWAAARTRLPKASPLHADSPLPLAASVPLGGPGDLRDFETYGSNICGPGLESLLGGKADEQAERYAQASPAELLPLGVRQILIVGEHDPVMPPRSREAYVEKAKKAGDAAELLVVPGSHFEVIAPGTEAFAAVKAKLLALLGR
jgi:acetyl esterase/lipase